MRLPGDLDRLGDWFVGQAVRLRGTAGAIDTIRRDGLGADVYLRVMFDDGETAWAWLGDPALEAVK